MTTQIYKIGFAGFAISFLACAALAAPLTFSERDRLTRVEQIGIIEDTGAANRIVAGDMLRILSQEIPAGACHLHNDIATTAAADDLQTSVTKFDAVVAALLNGDADMGIIGGETRETTVAEIKALTVQWEPVKNAAMTLLDDPEDAQAASAIYASADVILEKTYHLLSALEGEYANPVELLAADMLLLEVSGRMVAMTQRMAYEACRIWAGDATAAKITALEQAIHIFQASLTALRDGSSALGIKPPPTAEIATALADVTRDWNVISGYLHTAITGGVLDTTARADLYHRLSDKLHTAEKVEIMYQAYAKRVY